jgi:hypothetical protein
MIYSPAFHAGDWGYWGDCIVSELYKKDYEIMQFTRFYDKNGKEIWEGDIVQHEKYPTPLVVDWDWDQWGLFDGIRNEASIGKDDVEVIGNIYENSELLSTNDD